MLHLKQRGFTLTELMVSLGVLSILLLMGSAVMQYMMGTAGTADKLTDMNQLSQDAQDILSSPTLCTAVMKSLAPIDGAEVVLTSKIRAGAQYSKNLDIVSVKMADIEPIKEEFFRGVIRIEGKKRGNHLGAPEFIREASFFYEIDSDKNISTCVGEAYNPIASCLTIGGLWDSTFSRCDFCYALGGEKTGSSCRFKSRQELGNACPTTKVFQEDKCGWSIRQQAVQYINDLNATQGHVSSADIQLTRSELLALVPQEGVPGCGQAGTYTNCAWENSHGPISYSAIVFVSPQSCNAMISVTVACP